MPPNMFATFNKITTKEEHERTRITEPFSSALYKQSAEIATYIVQKELGQRQKWNKTGERLHELCVELKLKHEPFFNSIVTRLDINPATITETSKSVTREVLTEGFNFGRLVSVYTFCMVLCDYCNKNGILKNSVESIIHSTAEIVYENKGWFEKNGSWDGFMSFFSKPEDKLWKGFVITTVGLGAVAGLLYANS